MSLFTSRKKYEVESKRSVEVKKQLDAHIKTYPAARKVYDAGRPEVIRLTGELNTVRAAEGNSSSPYKKLEAELGVATRKRDKPLIEYGNVKANLEAELSQLNRFFIAEEMERWGDETKRVKDEEVDDEVPKEKEEPGTFSIGGSHRKLTNVEAIRLFQLKSLEKRNQLRDMTHNSIPEIEAFIEEAEAEMKKINLTPITVEIDAKAFQQNLYESKKEPGKMASGVLTKDGGVETKTPAEQEASLYARIDRAKHIFKPILK